MILLLFVFIWWCFWSGFLFWIRRRFSPEIDVIHLWVFFVSPPFPWLFLFISWVTVVSDKTSQVHFVFLASLIKNPDKVQCLPYSRGNKGLIKRQLMTGYTSLFVVFIETSVSSSFRRWISCLMSVVSRKSILLQDFSMTDDPRFSGNELIPVTYYVHLKWQSISVICVISLNF